MTIDQLQLIYKKDFTKPASNWLSDFEYNSIIKSFVNQIIGNNTIGFNKNCPSFFDIIYFNHNIPEFYNIDKWLVVSSKYFNAHSGKCFIVPNDSLDFAYLHSIDWKERQVKIKSKIIYTNADIQKVKIKVQNQLIV
ncbi:hypothetical protein [Brachyspira sp.]|uniref:hypothetical protein n=1 Tax=Brachyspira sp. TaxID=1977261 RepID=UPI003D7CEC8F